jgi:hypothetical protein
VGEADTLAKPFTNCTHPEDVEATAAELRKLADGLPTRGFESRMRHKDGGYRWIAWTAALDNGRIYAVARDVTAEKARAEEVAAVNRQLVAQIEERERVEETLRRMQRLEAVGQLTSGVAHDFNNLLTVVLGNTAFVRRGILAAGLDGKLLERLDHVRGAAERGATLTAQLLAFSRRQRLEARPVDLNATVSNMHDLLRTSVGSRVRLRTALDPSLRPALVTRRRSSWCCSTWRSTPATPWRAAVRCPSRPRTCGWASRGGRRSRPPAITSWSRWRTQAPAWRPRSPPRPSSPSSPPNPWARGRGWGSPRSTASPSSRAAACPSRAEAGLGTTVKVDLPGAPRRALADGRAGRAARRGRAPGFGRPARGRLPSCSWTTTRRSGRSRSSGAAHQGHTVVEADADRGA